MGLSFWHIMLVAVLVLLLFGKGKVPQLMGDIAAGIRNFKSGLREDDSDSRANVPEQSPQPTIATTASQAATHPRSPTTVQTVQPARTDA